MTFYYKNVLKNLLRCPKALYKLIVTPLDLILSFGSINLSPIKQSIETLGHFLRPTKPTLL